jgi:23S rRNA (uracil1939-C5)-methyltransferase
VTELFETEVVGLGHAGDGLVRVDGQTMYVPWTVTGDIVRAKAYGDARAKLVEVLSPSSARIEPVCEHFGECGGCVAQHFAASTYKNWRRAQILDALQARGFEAPPLEEMLMVPAGTRRRAKLAWCRDHGRVALGFRARGTHQIVDMAMCPALHPSVVAILGDLRRLAAKLETAGRFDVTACDNGLDVTVEQRNEPTLKMRDAITTFSVAAQAARVSWRAGQGGAPDLVIQHRTPVVTIFGVPMALPPATFLQPSVAGEAALQNLVNEMLGGAKRVADLFSGCGTLSLMIAQGGHVAAFDSDAQAIRALRAAAGAAGARGRSIAVRAEVRDLYRRPLEGPELKLYDAVVFDPPRAGASAQAISLARSKVSKVVAVSCSPSTFARDARLLVEGGYAMRRVVPIDQFVWSQHVELAALFER